MRTCGLSHQIMGPTIVKVAKTGFMRKIANLQLGHSVYLNTEHYFVSFGHFLAKNGQKVMS